MKDEFVVGLDIGSTAIRMAVGQHFLSNGKKRLNLATVVDVPAEGISRGSIVSIEDAVASVTMCVDKAEQVAGGAIEKVWVGISGSHIICQESKGVVGISRPSGEIGQDDVERAMEAARTVATPTNYEILHVVPKNFTIDNSHAGIKDPIGMTGIRLEVDALIIQGLTSQIKNLTKCVYRTGLGIEDLVVGILAAGDAVLTPRQKDLGVAVINIGAATTSLVVFEQGDVIHLAVLPIGSDHITSDIAIGVRTSIEVAEEVKKEYGTGLPREVSKKEELNLRELGAAQEEIVSRKYVAEIIEARAEEIFEKVNNELRNINRAHLLPAGAVLTGGGAKLHGIVDLAKRKLKLPVTLGYPIGLSSITDRINDLAFSTAIGLVVWGSTLQARETNILSAAFGRFKGIGKLAQELKKKFWS